MYIKELWRYPVKSMAGERLTQVQMGELGLQGDRKVLVLGPNGRIFTSRTHPRLLGLRGTLGEDGQPLISGRPWNSKEALATFCLYSLRRTGRLEPLAMIPVGCGPTSLWAAWMDFESVRGRECAFA